MEGVNLSHGLLKSSIRLCVEKTIPNSNPVCQPPNETIPSPCCNVEVPKLLYVTFRNVTGCSALEGVKLFLEPLADDGTSWFTIAYGGAPYSGTYVYCGNGGLFVDLLFLCDILADGSTRWHVDFGIRPLESCPVHFAEHCESATYSGSCNPFRLEFNNLTIPQHGLPTFDSCDCCESGVFTFDAIIEA